MQTKDIVALFKQKGFRATPQRIEVYRYLCDNPHHPDVEEIYKSLLQGNPSFSRTTVYNSLEALRKQGLIIAVNIDNQRVHYDAYTDLHGHFICEKCRRIFDFGIDGIENHGIDGFSVKQKDVYYSGLCPECK